MDTHVPDGPNSSLLDAVGPYKSESATEALRHSREAAVRADQFGITRPWLTEHHFGRHQVGVPPGLPSAHAAALTEHIRIGSGGVMLPNHGPLRGVEDVASLETLHPGRIDLGVGRASGTDGVTNAALRNRARPPTGQDLAQSLPEILAFFERSLPEGHPHTSISPSSEIRTASRHDSYELRQKHRSMSSWP